MGKNEWGMRGNHPGNNEISPVYRGIGFRADELHGVGYPSLGSRFELPDVDSRDPSGDVSGSPEERLESGEAFLNRNILEAVRNYLNLSFPSEGQAVKVNSETLAALSPQQRKELEALILTTKLSCLQGK